MALAIRRGQRTTGVPARCIFAVCSGQVPNPSEESTEPAILWPISKRPLVRFLVFITSLSSTASLIPYFRLAVAFCSATGLLYFFFVISLFLLRPNEPSHSCRFCTFVLFFSSSQTLNGLSNVLDFCFSCSFFSSFPLVIVIVFVFFSTSFLHPRVSRLSLPRHSPFLSSSPCCPDDSSTPPGLRPSAGHSLPCAMPSCR